VKKVRSLTHSTTSALEGPREGGIGVGSASLGIKFSEAAAGVDASKGKSCREVVLIEGTSFYAKGGGQRKSKFRQEMEYLQTGRVIPVFEESKGGGGVGRKRGASFRAGGGGGDFFFISRALGPKNR